jgi:hypothetical protein
MGKNKSLFVRFSAWLLGFPSEATEAEQVSGVPTWISSEGRLRKTYIILWICFIIAWIVTAVALWRVADSYYEGIKRRM